jgi:hypothetical protein
MERVDGDFVERTLEYMANVTPQCFTKLVADLTTTSFSRDERRIKRELILHYVGNITVIAAAGLDHAIPNRLLTDYHRVLRGFAECRGPLINHSIDIPPQIDEAIELMRKPHLDK